MDCSKKRSLIVLSAIFSTGLLIAMEAPTGLEGLNPNDIERINNFAEQYQPAGGVSYRMTVDQIKNHVHQLLDDQYKKGLVITKADFDKFDKNEWVKTKTPNLTRVWGANYLSKIYGAASNVKTPDHLIVVDDLNHIDIAIGWDECWPIINEVVKGTIYSKRIHGEPLFGDKEIQIKGGFRDYAKGNIIKTPNNEYFVVDTELASFYVRGNPTGEVFDNPRMPSTRRVKTCKALRKKFQTDNGIGDVRQSVYSFSIGGKKEKKQLMKPHKHILPE